MAQAGGDVTIWIMRLTVAMLWAGMAAGQVAVPMSEEPHHHLIYKDANVRAYSAEVAPKKATLVHRHDLDYLWVGIGYGEIAVQVPGKAPEKVISTDGALHFARGAFAHVVADATLKVFRNVEFELLKAQSNPRNRCEAVLQGEVMSCAEDGTGWKGALERPAFETDQTLVSRVKWERGTAVGSAAKNPRLLVALDLTELEVKLDGVHRLKAGEVLALPAGAACEVRNLKKTGARMLVLEFR